MFNLEFANNDRFGLSYICHFIRYIAKGEESLCKYYTISNTGYVTNLKILVYRLDASHF